MASSLDTLISMRDQLVGRDVEVRESGHLWRGPLKDIRVVNDSHLEVETEWSAEELSDGNWELITGGPFGINILSGTTQLVSWSQHGESIELSFPYIGSAIILPESAGHLNMAEVQRA